MSLARHLSFAAVCALLLAGTGCSLHRGRFSPLPGPAAGGKPALSTSVPKAVQIRFEVDDDAMPVEWMKTAVIEPLSEQYQEDARKEIQKALKKYPPGLLDRFLRRIYVFEDLRFDGMQYGGTYDPSLRHIFMGYFPWDSTFVEKTVHHEFSSILLLRNKSKAFHGPWAKLADPEAIYADDAGYEAMKSGNDSLEFAPEAHRKGYLNVYSMSAPEEDFNCFSEALFSGGKEFWAAVDKYPLLRKKADMAIAFYHGLDDRFTEGYFRSFAKE